MLRIRLLLFFANIWQISPFANYRRCFKLVFVRHLDDRLSIGIGSLKDFDLSLSRIQLSVAAFQESDTFLIMSQRAFQVCPVVVQLPDDFLKANQGFFECFFRGGHGLIPGNGSIPASLEGLDVYVDEFVFHASANRFSPSLFG